MTNGNVEGKKKYVLVVPDGAGDVYREHGKSPLATARTCHMDFIAREGVCGLMQTLYEDLPKESLVAQLGMLGWDPRRYYPSGRASCELLALENISLNDGDLAFRANLVRMDGRVLASYNADYIYTEQALALVRRINEALRDEFPTFELYHNADFRNTLVVRGAGVDPKLLRCPEPHENHGVEFDTGRLIAGADVKSEQVAAHINRYLGRIARLLEGEAANMIFPWSPSKVLKLPSFRESTGFEGPVAVVGCMDFLHGIAKAGRLDSFKVGNGRPDTDYRGKGAKPVELLSAGYEFVVCHINAPDEAAHMGDLDLKIKSLEMIDHFIVRPVVQYFRHHMDELGGVMIAPDHFTNCSTEARRLKRGAVHSSHPVPFALWNGRERDAARYYTEDGVLDGKFAAEPISHLELTRVLGVKRRPRAMNSAR